MPADPPTNLQVPSGHSIPDASERVHAENRTARDDISEGKFTFLNNQKHLGRPVEWSPDVPALWTFHLHYFNYLPGLDLSLRTELCREWIRANAAGSDPGWHPYPTSLRVINWCRAAPREPDILKSLYRQASYLYRHPETYLLGNHLLENARALVLVGHFFGDQGEAPSWFDRGLRIYREEIPDQVLKDGGHYERSPMYHALVLEGCLDVLSILPDDHPDRFLFAQTVRRMMDFIVALTHPNDQIALFNDSALGEAYSTRELQTYASEIIEYEPKPQATFPQSGYYIHNDDNVNLIIDGGSVGADHLPAHAHADIFSYELSIDGILFIVDTGVYEYKAGDMRDYVRSTRAHNTVCVDGVDQAECWDSFRVARRYPPRDVSFTQHAGRCRFEGCFDGYTQLIGDRILHRRCIEVNQSECWITIEDTVTGEGRHTVESRIHLHPEVRVQHRRNSILLERANRTLCISTGDSTVRFENGWYCPEFGLRESNAVIVLGGDHSLPAHLRYSIRY